MPCMRRLDKEERSRKRIELMVTRDRKKMKTKLLTHNPQSAIRNLLTRIVRALAEALFPTKCFICGSFYHPEQHQNGCPSKKILQAELFNMEHKNLTFSMLMAPFLCPTCSIGFLPVESPICTRCGMIFKSREGKDHVCGECLDSPKSFRIARALGIYDHALMAVVHCLKYKGKIQFAQPLGMLLFHTFTRFWDKNSIDLILPVPLHMKRYRMRGFNQAFLLIRDWVQIVETLNIKASQIHVDKEVLERSRWTEPQTGLGRKKRILNIKNAFSVSDPAKITEKRILLVDDVYTTGATANECTKALLHAGAKYVDVLTLARAM